MSTAPPPPSPAARSHCAACGGAFHCGVADDRPCWCTAFEVDAEKLAAAVAPDAGCLCPACLARLGKARIPVPRA